MDKLIKEYPIGELEDCPFCGDGKSLQCRHTEGTIIHPHFYIQCDNCGARTGGTDHDTHEEEWNTRATQAPDAQAERIRVLDEALRSFDEAYRSMPTGPDADKHKRQQMKGAHRKAITALNANKGD